MLNDPVSKYTDHHMTVIESHLKVDYAAKVMTDSEVESVLRAEQSVVVFPLPVGPVTINNPFGKATNCLNLEDKKAMFAARAMQHIYYRMLQKIVDVDYDIYGNKIRVSKFKKVGISLGVWAKYRLVY